MLARGTLLLLLLLLVGCDTQVWDFDAGAGGRADRRDDSDASTRCEAGVCACAAEQLACEGACIDPSTNVLHCGGCGQVCAEGERCRDAKCECSEQQVRCGATCANLQISPRHCGACNQACPGSQLCQNGQCL